MSRTFKSSVWALSLVLLCSTLMYANYDALGARGRLQKLSSGELEHAKKAYIEKMKAKQDARAKDAKANAAEPKPAALAVPSSCPSPLPKPHKKCVSAQKVITPQLCATNASIDDLAVKNNATVGGDLTVGGNETVAGDLTTNGKIKASFVAADRADFDVETTNVSYEDVNVIEDLRVWQTERFVTPNYDRFPDGALPQTTKIGPGETYEFTSLSANFIPQQGNDWNRIVHGIIDFSTSPYGCQIATDKEKLDFYSGAQNRLFSLMIDSPFSATEKDIKIGFLNGWGVTQNSTVMPANQQQFAAQAMNEILKGLLTVDSTKLVGKDQVTLFNLITQAKFYIVAWNAGNTLTNYLGQEYFGSANPQDLEAYLYSSAWYLPFANVALIPAYGFSSDGEYLVQYARALPGLYKLYPKILESWANTAIEGLKLGYYPHVLRSRPYTSAGQSTFGEAAYGYTPDIVQLVSSGNFPALNDSHLFAQMDYDTLLNASFEDQLSPDLLFIGRFTIEGLNPLPFLDMLVEQGVMDRVEADYIQEEARKTYDASVKPAILNFLSTLYLDDNSPLVRALRLTRFDDFGGEWGYKFIVNPEGNVKGIVKSGSFAGQTVFIDTLGEQVVVKDESGNPINVNLQDITLQRDITAGNSHYTNMAEIVLKLNAARGSDLGTPIPFYKKSDTPVEGVNPFCNWRVQFDASSLSLPEKLHTSGATLSEFFTESIDFYLNQWVTATFPPCTDWRTVPAPYVAGQPCCAIDDPSCTRLFKTREEAITEINKAGQLTADLEEVTTNPARRGIYAFVQHYKPQTDANGNPVYDFSIVEGYYTQAWNEVPQLKVDANGRITGPVIKALVDFGTIKQGDILFDPQAPLGPNGLINIDKLQEASVSDSDKEEYYRFLSSADIVNGKSARIYYFFYDFIKHSFEDYMTIGQNPLMPNYFSPYIVAAFNKLAAHTYLNITYASSSFYDPTSQIITFLHLLDYQDPRKQSIGTVTTILHEFIMGHAVQIPLTQMINSTGTGSWLSGSVSNAATAEGWAVFIETFFGPLFTSYLSKKDRYFNYIDQTGAPDPITMVPSISDTSRVAARLTWDTGYHFASDKPGFKASLAEHSEGFKRDTYGAFPITTEVGQRVPVGPTQGLNYGLGFMQIVGLFQDLPNALGQERYDELQANGNKATKYFFDLLLLDAQGYFISSLQPIYDEWALRVKNKVPPFDDPNYDGYPVDAFDAHTVPYVPGSNPIAYEFIDNPYIPGGFTFTFQPPVPTQAVSCTAPVTVKPATKIAENTMKTAIKAHVAGKR